jgi:hypothetical protein
VDAHNHEWYREAEEASLANGLTFLGLISLVDPPRDGVLEAVDRCRKWVAQGGGGWQVGPVVVGAVPCSVSPEGSSRGRSWTEPPSLPRPAAPASAWRW